MKTYTYRARNATGRVVDGTLEAEDSRDAYQQLEGDGLVPIKITPARPQTPSRTGSLFAAKVKDEDTILFTRQLSTMLRSGIPILHALEVLKDQTANPTLKEALETIGNRIAGGARLSEALSDHPAIFSDEYISIVVSGESGADLVQALLRIAEWKEREVEIRAEIKSALRYPVLVMFSLLGAAILMLVFVIPRFAAFFGRANVALPLPTRLLMGLSDLFLKGWPYLLGTVVVLAVAIRLLLRIPAVRMKVDQMKFYLPITGRLYGQIMISRFARIFSMLIRNGVPVLQGLEIASRVVPNVYLRDLTETARTSIEGGSSIYEGFSRVVLFPPLMTSLIAIGEKTGTLDDMLDFVIIQYDMDIKYSLKALTAMVEPVVTVVIGAAVLFFALAVYMPIWNLSKVIRR